MKNKIFLLLLTMVLDTHSKTNIGSNSSASGHNASNAYTENTKGNDFSVAPCAFTENKGQVLGYDGASHREVKYLYTNGNTQIFLLENGLAYQFTKIHYPEGYDNTNSKQADFQKAREQQALQQKIRIETYRMDMVLVGANQNAVITTEGKSKDYTNYYNRDVLQVYQYNKIKYHDIYPGIDWIIYTDGNFIKYDFVVKPGADPSQIKIKFKDEEDSFINKDGSFTLLNRMGSITEKKPLSLQGDRIINSRFKLKDKTLAFIIEDYNNNETLVIDPLLVWGTYYGGSDADVGYSCSADASGNVYLAGSTFSGNNIASGGHQNIYGGSVWGDAFLVKFNSSGVRLWATFYGDVENDRAYACATDAGGNVYLAGATMSFSNITSGGHQNIHGAVGAGQLLEDAFLVKFNSLGVRQWATYYGGSGTDIAYACVTDATGNIYLAGACTSSSDISSGGHQNTHAGAGGIYDAFLVKFNSSGIRQWGTYYGGLFEDQGLSCSADPSGNIYLAGTTKSGSDIASGGHQNSLGGGPGQDAFLVKFDGQGIRQWATYYGDSGAEGGYSCANDASGNVYLAGTTTSSTNIASGGHQNNFGVASDAFLAKFNSGGQRLWATYYGGTGNGVGVDEGRSCATDASGNVYLAGFTNCTGNIASGGYQNTGGWNYDPFIVKFNSGGIRQWASYYGGSWDDLGYSCATDASGNVYLAGYAKSPANIGSGGHQNTFGGTWDAFLAKFCGGLPQTTAISGNTFACVGSAQTYSIAINPNATGYSWSLPSGWSGTSTTNSISATAGTSGSLTIFVVNNGCSSSSVQTLYIAVDPSVAVHASTISVCFGNTVTLWGSGVSTYTWSGGVINNVPFSPSATAVYTVFGTSAGGCQSSMTIPVYVLPMVPILTLTATNTLICSGGTVFLTAAGAGSYTWTPWFFGSQIYVSPTISSTYSLTGSNGCNTASTTITVYVDHFPQLIVNSTNSMVCIGESCTLTVAGASSYTWSTFEYGSGIVVMPNGNSFYTVTGTNTCGTDTASYWLIVDPCTGLFQQSASELNTIIYPSPGKGVFFIKSENSGRATLVVHDLIGQEILSDFLDERNASFDISSHAHGIYFAEISRAGIVKRFKIVKE